MGEGPVTAVRFFDFSQTRKDLRISARGDTSPLPFALKQAAERILDSPLGKGDLFDVQQLEAVLEVTPTGATPLFMIVGSFDSTRARELADSWGWPKTRSGLFELYHAPDGSGVGVGPRRLVFSQSFATAAAVTEFRGGPGSLLALDGLSSLSISAGRPAAIAVAPPAKGCLEPRWMAVALKYLPGSSPTAAFVVQYKDMDTAAASKKHVQAGLASYLHGGPSRIEVVDVRRDSTVASVSSDDTGAAELLRAVYRGSQLERALEC